MPDRKPGASDRCVLLELDRIERRQTATVVLISGDIDYVHKLQDLRYKDGCRLVLIHSRQAKKELKAAVHRCIDWSDLLPSAASAQQKPDKPKDSKSQQPSLQQQEADAQSGQLSCPECGFTASSASSLAQHMTAKGHAHRCPADGCDKDFATEAALQSHQAAKNHYERRAASNHFPAAEAEAEGRAPQCCGLSLTPC